MTEARVRLNIRKNFFPVKVVRQRLPKETVAALCLEVFKAGLDEAWSNLIKWKLETNWSLRSLPTKTEFCNSMIIHATLPSGGSADS